MPSPTLYSSVENERIGTREGRGGEEEGGGGEEGGGREEGGGGREEGGGGEEGGGERGKRKRWNIGMVDRKGRRRGEEGGGVRIGERCKGERGGGKRTEEREPKTKKNTMLFHFTLLSHQNILILLIPRVPSKRTSTRG